MKLIIRLFICAFLSSPVILFGSASEDPSGIVVPIVKPLVENFDDNVENIVGLLDDPAPLNSGDFNPDKDRTCVEFVESRDFNAEVHKVTTADGYILELVRIVNSNAKKYMGSKLQPVLLMHGLLESCSCWMDNSKGGNKVPWVDGKRPQVCGNSLAFSLANAAYDVWMANSRGTKYSRKHVELNPEIDPKFWEFSYQEMGIFDLPAIVDYILKETNYEQIAYVGFSQGTLQFFILLSVRPDYKVKFRIAILLAPVFHLTHISGLFGLLPDILQDTCKVIKGPFLVPFPGFDTLTGALCNLPVLSKVCSSGINLIGGTDSPQIANNQSAVYGAQTETTSWQNICHYLQGKAKDPPKFFDYDSEKNSKKYGQPEPPAFPIQDFNFSDIVLMSGPNDNLADPQDVQLLRESLKVKPLYDITIDDDKWAHFDFIFAINLSSVVNQPVCKILDDIFFPL